MKTKQDNAFELYDQQSTLLFTVDKNDIVIYKERNKKKCYCQQQAFNYRGMRNVVVGKEGKSNPFTPTRIEVWEMESDDDQK